MSGPSEPSHVAQQPRQAEDIRLVIIDDDALVRAGFRSLLAPYPDLLVVGEGTSGLDLSRLTHELRPDVALLDVRMPHILRRK